MIFVTMKVHLPAITVQSCSQTKHTTRGTRPDNDVINDDIDDDDTDLSDDNFDNNDEYLGLRSDMQEETVEDQQSLAR